MNGSELRRIARNVARAGYHIEATKEDGTVVLEAKSPKSDRDIEDAMIFKGAAWLHVVDLERPRMFWRIGAVRVAVDYEPTAIVTFYNDSLEWAVPGEGAA